MIKLKEMKCRACEGLEDKLSGKQINNYLKELKSWKLVNNKITKEYKFKDFKSSLKFTNKIGSLAEKEGHHPDILLAWGKTIITLYTHSLKGLSINDFILASKIDEIKK